MPHSRAEEEPSRENPGNYMPPEGADERGQLNPTTNKEKTFLEHAEDSMNEHDLMGRLRAQ